MKFLIINGSPRRVNTWKIIERVKEKLNNVNDDIEFDEIDLMKENIPFCTGCYNCFINGEDTCPHANVIQPIVNKMIDADGVIISCPVYALNTTALLKNFIDHLAYFYHRPYFFEKKALIVVTTAGAGHKKVGNYIDETLRNMGYNERIKLCFVHSHDPSGYLPLKTKEKIDKETLNFYNSVKNKKLLSPGFKALFYYNLWRAVAVNANVKRDYDYWVENDLINHEFYPKINCNIFKRVLFKLFYKILSTMMSKNNNNKN